MKTPGGFTVSYKISLAGDLGSGKSTVSAIVTERTELEYYSTGAILRSVAAAHNMTVAEVNEYAETHPEIDREIDDGLIALSDDPRSLIIDSRMAWHFVKGNFPVYLTTEPEVAAARIFAAHRSEESFPTVEETAENIRRRRKSEQKRYFEKYGVDRSDLSNYRLVIDTTFATPEEVAEKMLSSFAAWKCDPDFSAAYICPLRLHYRTTSDADKVSALARALDRGEDIGECEVFFENEGFYVTSGTEIALAYALSDYPFVPCTLVKGSRGRDEYVRMTDSL